MRIVGIQRLDILECVHVAGRGESTLVSLSADGRRSFTVSLPRRRTPAAGGPTVAAYLDTQLLTLHAWLDPVSGEVFVADAHTPGARFFAALAAVLAALATLALLRVDAAWLGGTLAGVGIVAVLALGRQKLRDKRLEQALRARRAEWFDGSQTSGAGLSPATFS